MILALILFAGMHKCPDAVITGGGDVACDQATGKIVSCLTMPLPQACKDAWGMQGQGQTPTYILMDCWLKSGENVSCDDPRLKFPKHVAAKSQPQCKCKCHHRRKVSP